MRKAKFFAVLAGVVSLVIFSSSWLSFANERSVYLLPLAKPPVRPDVVILAIDNKSLGQLGQWPWDRGAWAALSKRLALAQPAGVAFDVNFSEPGTPDGDTAFAQSLMSLPRPVLSTQGVFYSDNQSSLSPSSWVWPLSLLRDVPGVTLGHPHIPQDRSHLSPVVFNTEQGRVEPLTNGVLDIPAGTESDFVSFLGQPGTIPTIPIIEVLQDDSLLPQLRGKWIFIGATASDLRDTVPTPVGLMAGVEWHATVASNVLNQDLKEPLPLPAYLALGLLILFITIFAKRRNSKIWQFFLWYGAGLAVVILISYVLWQLSYVFLPLAPAVAILAAGLVDGVITWLSTEKQRKQLQRTMQSYFSPAVLHHLSLHPDHIELGGVKKDVTILFSDIRGFTTISESIDPQLLSKILQEYFTSMTGEILKTDGVVDKFIGDAIMAFWGAPLEQQDHADRAIATALGMLKNLPQLNSEFKTLGWPDIKIGIGLNSGSAVVGNLGSRQRFDYTVIGDPVNLAARLESSCKDLGVPLVVSEFTKTRAKKEYAWRSLGGLTVKGKTVPVDVFTVEMD